MNSDIIYWNPKSCAHEKEEVYGEKWLLFIYHNFWGKLSLWALVKRAWFSKWYGWKMDRRSSKTKVLPFIEKYKLNTNEFLEPPKALKPSMHFSSANSSQMLDLLNPIVIKSFSLQMADTL